MYLTAFRDAHGHFLSNKYDITKHTEDVKNLRMKWKPLMWKNMELQLVFSQDAGQSV